MVIIPRRLFLTDLAPVTLATSLSQLIDKSGDTSLYILFIFIYINLKNSLSPLITWTECAPHSQEIGIAIWTCGLRSSSVSAFISSRVIALYRSSISASFKSSTTMRSPPSVIIYSIQQAIIFPLSPSSNSPG
ncbi:hypothetical protein CJ20_140 [Escherichia phage CJ20]|nr:hypothetical protein CJ20_140 [Escherichia phage CJ20]